MARYKGTGKYWDGVDKCPAGDGNCLDEVVVRAPRKADLIVAIGNGTLPTYLTDHPEVYQDLTASGSSLTTSYIDGLKSGQYNAVFKTDLPLGFPSDNKVILIGEGLVTNTDYEVLFVLK
ncbi:MAG: hypothetical protein JSS64_00475 [Bacteroidetes bacterium]|nr:hypothetical protein [Bacteroidota bacterium]